MPSCRKCGSELDNSNWYPSHKNQKSYICKVCELRRSKQRRLDNPEERRAYDKKWRENHKEGIVAYNERYRLEHKESASTYFRLYYQNLKREVITRYSATSSCLRCGESNINLLSIDHINDDGAQDRRARGRLGFGFYLSLRKENYPDGYQILCMNCNWLKRETGRTQRALNVISHYSNGTMRCARCENSNIGVLSIDHINGGGLKHQREIGRGNLMWWLIKHRYPTGYQVLCMNCQHLKRLEMYEIKK